MNLFVLYFVRNIATEGGFTESNGGLTKSKSMHNQACPPGGHYWDYHYGALSSA